MSTKMVSALGLVVTLAACQSPEDGPAFKAYANCLTTTGKVEACQAEKAIYDATIVKAQIDMQRAAVMGQASRTLMQSGMEMYRASTPQSYYVYVR